MLREQTCCLLARLGEGAFESNAAAGAFVSLLIVQDLVPARSHEIKGTDASEPRNVREKENHLRTATISSTGQKSQLGNPDARISLATDRNTALLEKHAHSYQGIATADYARFGRCFWELSNLPPEWEFQQSTVKTTVSHGGREHVFLWEKGSGLLAKSPQARVQGLEALRKQGVAVSQMRTLPCTLYCGDYFDNNTAVIVPEDPIYLPAIWAFCSSSEFNTAVRQIDSAIKVTNATLVKVPFDLEHWQSVAEELWPGRSARAILRRPDPVAVPRQPTGKYRSNPSGPCKVAGVSMASAGRRSSHPPCNIRRHPPSYTSGRPRARGRKVTPSAACGLWR